MYIFGPLEDQTKLIVWSQISDRLFGSSLIDNWYIYKLLFSSLLTPWATNQPIYFTFVSVFATIFGQHSYNYLLLLSFVLNFIFSYLFFKKFKFGVFYALVFTFSGYAWLRFAHLALLQIWIFPAFLLLLNKFKDNTLHFKWLGFFVAFATLISNYYGYFVLVLFTLDSIITLFKDYKNTKKIYIPHRHLKTLVLAIFLILVGLTPFIYNTIKGVPQAEKLETKVNRSYTDFILFSSHPAYYFIPSTKNPIIGDFHYQLEKFVGPRIWNKITYTYFPKEHTAAFFGYSFYLLFITALIIYLRQFKKLTPEIKYYFSVIFVLVLLSFPPEFRLSGVTFYTPTYLLYKVTPMFRNLNRLNIVILLYMLYITGLLLKHLYEKSKTTLGKILVPAALLITIAETFIPFNISKIDTAPAIYSFLFQHSPPNSTYVVYPYNKALNSLFWLNTHKRNLVNPRNYHTDEFDSENFTKNLYTPASMEQLLQSDVNYLVLFNGAESEQINSILTQKNILPVFEDETSMLYILNGF